MPCRWICIASLALLAGAAVRGEAPKSVPQGDKEPLLCLQAGGPTAFVTGLAFSPDGKTLYATGFDKVVRVWTLNPPAERFVLDRTAYRVPIGPGLEGGALNALALSPDGTWLAVAGFGLTSGGSGFHMPGWTLPVVGGLSADMRRDQGMIYVFNTTDGSVRILRGHTGPVSCLAFAPVRENVPPLLVSAAREWDEKKNEHAGAVLLWDLDKAAYLAGYVFPDRQTKPALAVQTTGRHLKQLRVAIAWEDRVLRVWDVASDKLITGKEAENNNTAAYFADPAHVLTGSANGLRLWQLQGAQANVERQVPLPGTKAVAYYPRALALCSAAAGGKLDHAAVVVRRVTRAGEEDWLYLFDLNPTDFGAVKARVLLGRDGGNVPVLATAPRGPFLAVAGYEDHVIRVYSVAELLNGRGEPRQALRSAGVTMRHVRFVGKGKNLGLLLSESVEQGPEGADPAVLPDGLIFDFANRSLRTDRSGWRAATPTVDGWQRELSRVAEAKDDRGRVVHRSFALVVTQGARTIGRTELQEIGDVTAYALLPPQRGLSVPLLAIAHRDKYLQPRLGLYDAASGQQVRQCNGHLDRIRALAFSADGKLLASAADDQTVCVWSLADLDQILKQRGMLQGVAVAESGNDLFVAQLDAQSLAPPNRRKLRVGDVLEGIVEAGKFRPLTSAHDFYEAIWHTKAGDSVALRVRGRPEGVRLQVGQGADERKPLFSLFLAHRQRPEKWDWVGWSPVGFYDGSGGDAERYVGWHFNTGKPDQPTSFALADQYHNQYYRQGILQRLVEEGQLPKQEPAEQLPRPNMTLWIDEAGLDPEQVDGRVLVRRARATLKLAINNFPLEKVASLQCRLNGGTPLDFPPGPGEVRSLTLSLERGRHDLRVALRTLEADAKNYEEPLAVVYLPPPPNVLSKLPRRQVVDKPGFHFRAAVRPALPGHDVSVRLLHKHNDQILEQGVNQGPEIDRDFQLRPGENLIEVVAQNKGAVRPYEEFETNRQVWSVTYRKKDPPLISLNSVLPLSGAQGRTLAIEPGKPVIVDTPRVRLEGHVKASEKLAEAGGKLGEAALRPLAKFEPHKVREFAIREELTLRPGPQKFRVQAKTEAGAENETAVTIDYRPRLPRLVLSSPRPGTVLYEGQGPREIHLAGALEPPPGRDEFAVAVVVNGDPTDGRPVLDPSRQKLTARVPLQFGDNRIQVRLSNPWHVTSLSEPVLVRYLRPPGPIDLGQPQAGLRLLSDYVGWPRWATWPGVPQVAEKPVVDLRARLHSARPLTFVQAEVNGRRITATEAVPPTRPQDTTWTVRLKDVSLDLGRNVVRLWASNEDGRCPEPGTLTIFFRPPEPPPPPPEVEILDPRRDVTVDGPSYTVRYRARSRSRLRRVELRRDGQLLYSADAATLKKDAQGFVEVKAAAAVKLFSGANRFQVLAVNAGGQCDAAVTVSYVYKPVSLAIEKLELRGQPSRFFAAEKKENNRLVFSEVPAGELWLHGRVQWVDEGDERLKLPTQVLVWINGFKQLTELKPWPGKGLDRAFEVEMRLSQPRDNRVEIQLPDLPQEQGKSHEFSVDCRQPVPRKQRLHLLIVGNGERDQDRLTRRVLGALQATSLANGRFKTPAFEEGYVHGVLAGEHVEPQRIWAPLGVLKRRLSVRLSGDHASDVVMVYYQGSEGDWSRFTPDNLTGFFARAPGAQVLLLDVTRDAAVKAAPLDDTPEQPGQTPSGPHVGVFCYVWLNPGHAQTDDARLINDLRAALSKAGTLKDVVSTLDGKFRWDQEKSTWVSRKYPDSLLYGRHFPDTLLNLLIGAQLDAGGSAP